MTNSVQLSDIINATSNLDEYKSRVHRMVKRQSEYKVWEYSNIIWLVENTSELFFRSKKGEFECMVDILKDMDRAFPA